MDAFDINQKLLRLYGRDTVYDQPNYRLVWSPFLTEKREGKYEDKTESGIYLGTKVGIREVKKYWYLPPCWILEKFYPVFKREVYDEVKEPFMYECLFPFLDASDKPLPLAWRPIEFVIHGIQRAERDIQNNLKGNEVSNAVESMKEEIKKKEEAEVLKTRDILEESDPVNPLPTFKSSVLVGDKANG